MEGKYFQREKYLLNMMTSDNDEPELSNLSISEDKKDDFYHGRLPERFRLVKCPFTWVDDMKHDRLEQIASKSQNFVAGDPKEWQTCCTYIFHAYCFAKLGKFDEALEKIQACEELLTNNADDIFFKDIFKGVDHVVKSSMAYIHFIKGEAEKADEIISQVTLEEDLSKPGRAALLAIHATVSHDFELKSKEEVIAMFKKAIVLDPDDEGSRRGAWYFFVGKRMGQHRRMKYRNEMPSEDEVKYLERAIKYKPFPDSLATFGLAKTDAAKSLTNNHSIDEREIYSLHLECKILLMQAIQLDGICSNTLRRCGAGLMYLPPKFQDIPTASECLEKSISLNPKNAAAYHALGFLEEIHKSNFINAVKYYKLSVENGNLLSASREIRLRFKMDNNYNPLQYCDMLIEKDNWPAIKAVLNVIKGEYYLYVPKDLMSAAKEWEKAMELAPGNDCLKKHPRIFSEETGRYSKYTVNIYQCLKGAIKARSRRRFSDEDELYLDRILKICEEHT